MIKNEQSFNKAQKRVIELQELQKRLPFRLSYDDQEELSRLMEACQEYRDALRSEQLAEQAVYDDMMAFEERFMNSMER